MEVKSFEDVMTSTFQGIFFIGGHATLWDFPEPSCAAIHKLAASIYEKGGCIGAVCHGPR
jgi:putative intracellular protease/amidase